MTKIKAKIFFSYSHKDENLREQLNTHLSILKRNELIEEWHDRKITPGQDWRSEIDKHLDDSDIVILLISPDFIASEYCYANELSRAIERHEANQSIVIPIIVRPVNWSNAPFAKIQALPKDAIPVTTWPNIDEAWMTISEEIQKAISDVAKLKNRKIKSSGLKQVSELLILEADRIDQIYQADSESYSGIPTGINDLDEAIDGLHSPDLIVVGSRPKNGSDDLAINIAKHISIDVGLPVAYYSFQIPSDRLTQKLICAIGGINHHKLLRGMLEEDDWGRLTNALSRLNEAPLFIDDNNTLTLDELISNVKELKSNTGTLALIIIDSIQSLFFQSNSKTSIDNYTKSLKYLAKELKTPILVTSNLCREAELRIDKRPIIKDFGDWTSIEDEADTILLTYVDEIYNPDSIDRDTIEILIAKNTYGSLGKVRAIYSSKSSIFSNLKKSEYDF
jgi:replicative DNA helicase